MTERRSPLYDFHSRSAREIIRGGGDFMVPLAYTSTVDEHLNVRKNVGMQDLSSMGEIDVKGPGAERLLRRLIVNEIADMEPGQLRYSTMCNDAGGIVDDITVYKFNDEHFMVVTSSGPRPKTARWIAERAAGASAYATDITGGIALLVVQGPRSRSYLKTVVENADLDRLKFFRFTPARVAGIDLLISRSGYTGELGYELYTPAEQALVLWEQILRTSREFNLQPYGIGAMQSLRIEKAYPLYGADLNEDYTPFHAGLDRFIAFEKRDFVGRDALLRIRERGLERRWVGLVVESEVPAAVGDKIYSVSDVATFRGKMFSGSEAGAYRDTLLSGEQQVGHVTCSAKGHTVGKMLAMAYLNTAHSWPGNNLIVEINGRPVVARVSATPFFDPQNARVRAKPQEDDARVAPPTRDGAPDGSAGGAAAPTKRLASRDKAPAAGPSDR